MYFLLNNKLELVMETEIIYPNIPSKDIWMCVYYFENDKLLYLESVGHGKSESNNWHPEKESMQMFKKRYAYLTKIMN